MCFATCVASQYVLCLAVQPAYEAHRGTSQEINSDLYNDGVRQGTLLFAMLDNIHAAPAGLDNVIKYVLVALVL